MATQPSPAAPAAASSAGVGKGVVYGVHEFSAENGDEISFAAGEEVIVLEKDDQYGDGWWQGRNAAGDEGLFPVSYTSPERAVPPTDEPTGSQQSQTSPVEHALGAAAIPPRSPPRTAAGLGMPVSDSDRSVGGESSHMTETITDIQQAIEQLAVTSSTSMNGIESRSMRSFQSREDSHYDDSIIDGAIKDDAGDETEHDVGWSATTRQRLAEKAMSENKKREQKEMDKEIKRREREETEKQSWGAGGIPHGVEFSDESEDELDDHAGIHAVSTTSPHGIEPIDHRLGSDPSSSPLVDGAAPLAVPVAAPVSLDRVLSDASPVGHSPELANTNTNGNESHFAVGVAASSGRAEPPSELAYTSAEDLTPGQRATRALESAVSEPSAVSQEPSPYHTVVPDQPAPNSPPTTTTSASAPADASRALGTPVSLATPTLPASSPTHAPATTTPSEQVFNNPFTHQQDGAGTGTPSPASVIDGGARPASPTKSSSRRPSSMSTTGLGAAGVPGEPLEWGIDEVVEWAKRRGFGADIYDKFLEHEITGDVLLELDINLLKEIDITAFGKRHKVATAIADLRSQSQPHGGVGSSIRSLSTSQHPQSPTYNNPPLSSGRDSVSNGLPSPGYVFASAQQQQQQQYMSPDSARGEFGETISPSSANGGYGSVVGLGLGGANDTSRSRENSYGGVSSPPSPPRSNGTFSQSMTGHGRTPSGVPSLVGTQIAEEPESKPALNVESSSVGSSGPASSKGFASKPEAASSKTDVGSINSKHSSIPASPSSTAAAGSMGKRGSMTHKKSKPSVDESKGSSTFGNFLTGSRNGRKPAPRLSSGALNEKSSPDLSADKGAASATRAPKSSTTSPSFRRASKVDEAGTPARLRKRMSVAEPAPSAILSADGGEGNPARALDRLPKPDFAGYLRKKGERYNSWKMRYCVLSGPHLYYLKSENDAKFKGYINMAGYKVIADENANPGYYGFRIIHDKEAPHFFSLQEQGLVREWMKALMKATISRDYSTPVVSSCNIPTMTLKEAQTMSPAPRPPSPSERAAMQAASRRENPNQLTARDASVLMGLPSNSSGNARSSLPGAFAMPTSVPPRPSREQRRPSGPVSPIAKNSPLPPRGAPASLGSPKTPAQSTFATTSTSNNNLAWVNSRLPKDFPPVTNNPESFRSGLALVRLVETITQTDSQIAVSDFVVKTKQEHEDLLYRAFDYFIDAGVDVDGLHVEDVVIGNPQGIDRIIERIRVRAT